MRPAGPEYLGFNRQRRTYRRLPFPRQLLPRLDAAKRVETGQNGSGDDNSVESTPALRRVYRPSAIMSSRNGSYNGRSSRLDLAILALSESTHVT
jgi:hypothetical protein